MTSFYSENELLNIGFKSIGKNVLVSRKASIYSAKDISIGSNVRIDDSVILSGNISIGNNIHISAYAAIYGAYGVILEDYTGLSPRVTIYSAMDDFSGNYLIGPIHPVQFTNVKGGLVRLSRFAHIGANSIVFPNIKIGEGTVVGAMSLVTKDLESWTVFVGVPVKKIKDRENKMLNLI